MLSLVKRLRRPREGGECAHCGRPYTSKDGHRYLCENSEGIVEPYNLCNKCGEMLEEQRRI